MMKQHEVRERALAFVREALDRDAYYLDSAQTDDGWLVRVIVVETKRRAGSAPVKVWHTLHEVLLDTNLEPVYHIRRGLWDKELPSDLDQAEGSASLTEEAQEKSEPAGVSDTSAEVDSGRQAHLAGEEAESTVPSLEAPTEETPLPEEVMSEEGPDEDEPADEDLADLVPSRDAAAEEGGPSRPLVQEKQGPPRLSLRYIRGETLREPVKSAQATQESADEESPSEEEIGEDHEA